MTIQSLNHRAWQLCQELESQADQLRIRAVHWTNGGVCWDFGNEVPGGLAAGLTMARVGLSNLAHVELVADTTFEPTGLAVLVRTDHPWSACMASQYAGWKIGRDEFFAMGSGPMRAAAASEALFQKVGREATDCAVGVLESAQLPTMELAAELAERCQVAPDRLCLLVARTASLAGSLQVVARSVETALHKLMDLQFDINRVESGCGLAPLPPIAVDDLTGIGRTNDAILYGARVTLWVRGDDDSLRDVMQHLPSCSSHDYGQPFGKIFAQYDHDFYKIDPHLFSPAVVRLVNLDTGHSFAGGRLRADLLLTSFQS